MAYPDEEAARLNAHEDHLKELAEDKERIERSWDMIWQQVFHIFDGVEGAGMPASFVCQDGFKLARLVPNMQPVIDEDMLLLAITSHMGVEDGNKLWKRVTDVTRTVNQEKLADVITKNPALGEAIDKAQCITKPERKPSRIRREASKAERMLLQAQDAEEEAVG